MKPIVTLYNMLGVNRKLPDRHLRVLYLKEVWGLPQKLIAECENTSQPVVSQLLKESSYMYQVGDITALQELEYTEEEIKSIQMLPRTIIKDIPVMAFINNILGLKVDHAFYENVSVSLRIVALNSLGIQQKHLQKIFGRAQSNISMTVKRTNDTVLDREFYYRDKLMNTFKILNKKEIKFVRAGGYEQ